MISTKGGKKAKDFLQVAPTKPIRIGGADNFFEKKQADLQDHLKKEK